MKARAAMLPICAFATLLASATPAIAVDPVKVVATGESEIRPAASTTYVAWTVNTFVTPGPFLIVYAKAIADGDPFQVNPEGTNAVTGGIDGSTLAYELLSRRDSNIALFDLSARTELDVPEGVNTDGRDEYSPSISGTRLLFGRGGRHRHNIVLFDTPTGTSQVLYSKADTERRRYFVEPGQVNGNYAVWGAHRDSGNYHLRGCNVWLYDIAAETATKLANPDGLCQYAPSVDAEGTVYFGRSGLECGLDAQIIEQPLGGTESVLYEFRRGRDFGTSNAVNNADGTTDVYFDNGNCRRQDFDILKLASV